MEVEILGRRIRWQIHKCTICCKQIKVDKFTAYYTYICPKCRKKYKKCQN